MDNPNLMTGSEAAASASLDAKIDALTSPTGGQLQTDPTATTGAETQAPAPSGASVEAQPEAAPAESQPAETQPEAQPGEVEPTPEGEVAPDEDFKEGEKPNVPGLSDTRWDRYKYAYNWGKQVVKAITGADLSKAPLDPALLPTVEEIQQQREASLKQAKLEATFLSGNPQHAAQFLDAWNQMSPQAMEVLASQVPEYLAQTNFNAYARVADPVINRFMDGMYQAAMAQPDAELRDSMIKGAQVAEWWFTGGPDGGTYRKFDGTNQPAAPDPLAEREQAINQRWRQIQEHEQRTAQQVIQTWTQQTDSAIEQNLVEEADKALAPLKTAYANTPTIYEALKNQFIAEVRKHIAAEPSMEIFQFQRDRAAREGTDASRANLINQHRQMTARAIAAYKQPFLKAAGHQVVAANQQRHDQLQRAASRPAPGPAGAPPQRPLTPDTSKMSFEDKFNLIMSR